MGKKYPSDAMASIHETLEAFRGVDNGTGLEKENISKVEMARSMHTSRAALDRFLTPGNASVTLQTLSRAARAIGRDLRIELV